MSPRTDPSASGEADPGEDAPPAVLLVDDDEVTRLMTAISLRKRGFEIVECGSGEEALESLQGGLPDIVVLDVDLEDLGGFGLLSSIVNDSDVPVIVLLPEPNEHGEWMCFQAGAADVISPSTSKRVLLARIHAVVKRHPQHVTAPSRTIDIDPLKLDLDARTLDVHGNPVPVTRIEFDLLAQLMSQPRRVHIRSELIQSVWGAHYPDHIVETHLSRLRKKIRAAGGPEIGEAVRGIGYRLGVDASAATLVS